MDEEPLMRSNRGGTLAMHSLSILALAIGSLTLAGCAETKPPEPPPPPRHPAIEGNFKSVSSADIRRVLDLMRESMIKEYGSALPIYRVEVTDHNHIIIHYWADDTETSEYAERVKGKWKLGDIKRVIVTGSNIPTS
jgi:hypothetical protein